MELLDAEINAWKAKTEDDKAQENLRWQSGADAIIGEAEVKDEKVRFEDNEVCNKIHLSDSEDKVIDAEIDLRNVVEQNEVQVVEVEGVEVEGVEAKGVEVEDVEDVEAKGVEAEDIEVEDVEAKKASK